MQCKNTTIREKHKSRTQHVEIITDKIRILCPRGAHFQRKYFLSRWDGWLHRVWSFLFLLFLRSRLAPIHLLIQSLLHLGQRGLE